MLVDVVYALENLFSFYLATRTLYYAVLLFIVSVYNWLSYLRIRQSYLWHKRSRQLFLLNLFVFAYFWLEAMSLILKLGTVDKFNLKRTWYAICVICVFLMAGIQIVMHLLFVICFRATLNLFAQKCKHFLF